MLRAGGAGSNTAADHIEASRLALAQLPRHLRRKVAWSHLVAIAVGASRTGGLFLWHRWQRAATNLRLIRAALAEAPR
jgi:hypothetical protein